MRNVINEMINVRDPESKVISLLYKYLHNIM